MNKFYRILNLYFKNNHSEKVQALFGRWLIDDSDSNEKESAMHTLWHEVDGCADYSTFRDLEKLHSKIQQPQKKHSLLTRFGRTAAAAAILILCSFLGHYITQDFYVNNSGLVECFTDYGESKEIILPDGTEVWLGAGSLLVYPERFNGKTRSVYLSGEANFNVAKNLDKRLIVKTNDLEVEALGTVFYMQSYRDLSKVTITLEEGKVKVGVFADEKSSYTLLLNEQIVYDSKTKEISRRTVNAKRMALRREKYLVFQEASFVEIIHAIEKKFGVIFYYDSTKYEGRFFTLRFSPDEGLEETLDILHEVTQDFRYKIKDKTIYVL